MQDSTKQCLLCINVTDIPFLSLDATYISVCTYNQEHSIQDAKTLLCDVTGQVLEPVSINECSGIACALSSNAIVFNANLASNNCQIQNCTEQELANLPVTSSDPGFNIHVSSDVTPASGSSYHTMSHQETMFFSNLKLSRVSRDIFPNCTFMYFVFKLFSTIESK